MEIKAFLRYLNISPRKVRLVTKELKGKKALEAVELLDFVRKRGALPVKKLLLSAIANARHNFKIPEDNLFIKEIAVDEGPMHKRVRFESRGRVHYIRRRTSHLRVVLEEIEPGKRIEAVEEKKEKKEKAPKRETGRLPREITEREEIIKPKPIIGQKGFFRRKSIGG